MCTYVIFTDLVVAVLKSLGFAFNLAFSLFPKRHTHTYTTSLILLIFLSLCFSSLFAVPLLLLLLLWFYHSYIRLQPNMFPSIFVLSCVLCVERARSRAPLLLYIVVFRPICSHTACTFHLCVWAFRFFWNANLIRHSMENLWVCESVSARAQHTLTHTHTPTLVRLRKMKIRLKYTH